MLMPVTLVKVTLLHECFCFYQIAQSITCSFCAKLIFLTMNFIIVPLCIHSVYVLKSLTLQSILLAWSLQNEESQYFQISICSYINSLSTNPTKWSDTLKQFIRYCRRIVCKCQNTTNSPFVFPTFCFSPIPRELLKMVIRII